MGAIAALTARLERVERSPAPQPSSSASDDGMAMDPKDPKNLKRPSSTPSSPEPRGGRTSGGRGNTRAPRVAQ
jgi:hypothetical protein